ncbi:protein VAPYRIN-like [Rhododendron vialii]|uniref:protein VAPYRIN-like n=1 Tax=Rhododendron vialii TaxID=182163 RepID=UPI00265F1135|nr:protein VAPYRIN-like [Rhododendron vialii]
MERLVEASEQEVKIDFVLGTKCRANVRLRSLVATAPVAFKVQTSSPNKFLVNPPSGLIQPLSHATFQVVLKPQSQLPATFPRSPFDRFLVRTGLAPTESTHPEFTHDIKLKVAFVGPFLLRHAVAAGDVDAVRKIIKRQRGIVAEFPTREAESLLRAAAELENPDDVVSLLVEDGLKADGAGARSGDVGETRWASKGWTDLHVAAAFGRTEEVSSLVRASEERGPLLDCRDKEGRTPLHLAASKGHERCARVLAGVGADVNAASKDGRTALYRAAANGDRRMVEVLVELGADPTVGSMDRGRSAIHVARDKGHTEVVNILERGEAVLEAARRGDLNHLESLLDRDASVSFRDQYGLTALHVAAFKGHKDAVMMLVELGSAELECRDHEGHTPLHLAVEGGHAEMVEVLVNRGANVNASSKKGATPLYLARAMGYDDISQFLVDSGAAASSLPSTPSSLSSIL